MAGVTFTVELDDAAARAALSEMVGRMESPVVFYKRVGEYLTEEAVPRNFASEAAPDGQAWASLSKVTVIRAGETEIRQIADRDRDMIIDADVIAGALSDADNTIDGYVGAKYAVPLASTPKIVTTWAVSIARYHLHRNGAPDHVEADYKAAIAALKDVARGLIVLPVVEGNPAPASNGGGVLAAHPDQVFTPARLRGW